VYLERLVDLVAVPGVETVLSETELNVGKYLEYIKRTSEPV